MTTFVSEFIAHDFQNLKEAADFMMKYKEKVNVIEDEKDKYLFSSTESIIRGMFCWDLGYDETDYDIREGQIAITKKLLPVLEHEKQKRVFDNWLVIYGPGGYFSLPKKK